MKTDINLEPLAGETELSYLWRIGGYRDANLVSLTWDEIADLMERHFGEKCGESKWRKDWNTAARFNNEIFSKVEDEDLQDELDDKKRELERLKVQYRDERNAWSKQNLDSARLTETLDILSEKLTQIGRKEFSVIVKDDYDYPEEKTALILISDMHIGEFFRNAYGEFNTKVAEQRMAEYAQRVRDLQAKEYCEDAVVALLGDSVSGSFRPSIAITNRENVIDQIKIASELVANFCYEMCKIFDKVRFVSVSGNHSRLVLNKDMDNSDERLDDLVAHIVGVSLNAVSNFEYAKDANVDNSLATLEIRGKNWAYVHGDRDPYSRDGALKIMNAVGKPLYGICYGHLHTNAFQDADGIKLIRGGSLCGSGDNYTRGGRMTGKASQMVVIVDKDGVESLHPVEFE